MYVGGASSMLLSVMVVNIGGVIVDDDDVEGRRTFFNYDWNVCPRWPHGRGSTHCAGGWREETLCADMADRHARTLAAKTEGSARSAWRQGRPVWRSNAK